MLNVDGVQVYCQSSLAGAVPQILSAGTYYFSVRDYPGDDAQAPYNYDLTLHLDSVGLRPTNTPFFAMPPLYTPVPTPTPLPGGLSHGTTEIEPNNESMQAQPIRMNRSVDAAIDSPGDSDWFEFTTLADQRVSIYLQYSPEGQFRPYIVLVDKAGQYLRLWLPKFRHRSTRLSNIVCGDLLHHRRG